MHPIYCDIYVVLPSAFDILRYILSCRAIAIYDLPINLRYIYKRVSPLVLTDRGNCQEMLASKNITHSRSQPSSAGRIFLKMTKETFLTRCAKYIYSPYWLSMASLCQVQPLRTQSCLSPDWCCSNVHIKIAGFVFLFLDNLHPTSL